MRRQPDPLPLASVLAAGRYRASLLSAIDAALALDETERPQDIAAWRPMLRPHSGAETTEGQRASPTERGKYVSSAETLVAVASKGPKTPEPPPSAGSARGTRLASRLKWAVAAAVLLATGAASGYTVWRAAIDATNAVHKPAADADDRQPLTPEQAKRRCRGAPTKSCLLDLARDLAREIPDAKERADALLSVARSNFRAGQRAAAEKTLSEARPVIQMITDDKDRRWTLYHYAERFAELGRVDDALRTLEDAPSDPTGHPYGLAGITHALADAGDVAQAERILSRLTDKYMRARALARIGRAHVKAGRTQDADRAFAAAIQEAKAETSLLYYGLADVVRILADAGRFAEALRLLDDIDERETSRAIACLDVAERQAQARQVDPARATLARCEGDAGKLSRESFRRVVPARAAAIRAQHKLVADSLTALAEARDRLAGETDSTWRRISLEWVANGMAAIGRLHDAKAIARNFDKDEDRDRIHYSIVSGSATAGRFAVAIETADEIKSQSTRVQALLAVVEALAK
jgi:tetratricopeptide (TPR) repeat protein